MGRFFVNGQLGQGRGREVGSYLAGLANFSDRDEGWSLSEISKELNISKKTLEKALPQILSPKYVRKEGPQVMQVYMGSELRAIGEEYLELERLGNPIFRKGR